MMLKNLMEKYDSFVIAEQTAYTTEDKNQKIYYMKQVNRKEKTFLLKMITNMYRANKIYRKEKPKIIFCTGVLAMIPICLIAKIHRKKLVYIEAFAKVSSPTLTGKFLYKFSDQFYVQWPEMQKFYPRAIYLGGIY